MALFVYPRPSRMTVSGRANDLTKCDTIVLDHSVSDVLKRRCLDFRDSVQPFFSRPLRVAAGTVQKAFPLVNVRMAKSGFVAQGYGIELKSGGGFEVRACDEAGVFYALETIRQIVVQSGASVRCVSIEDSPDLEARGIMLDVSRCRVPTMQSMHKLIDLMARLKLNQLQLYIEHTFAFSAHEAVWHDSSPFTADEIIALDVYCRERFVELVPNFNSFGHFERWLKHPAYRSLAECPDGCDHNGRFMASSLLKPNRASLTFLDELYAEYLPNFSSPLFNVGCDETWQLGCGWSRKMCEKKGTTRVYVDHLLNIAKLARKHGRTMMFWADIIIKEPKFVKELPTDIIALEWGYEDNSPYKSRCPVYRKAGVPFYVCPGTSSWNSLLGRTDVAMKNLSIAAEHGLKSGSIGYLITDWGDGGNHQYLPISYPGFTAGAGFSWGFGENSRSDVAEAMNRLIFMDDAGVMGGLLMELGNVHQLVPRKLGNQTVFNSFLFRPVGTVTKDLKSRDVRKCLNPLDVLERRLGDTRMKCGDAGLIKSEIMNGIAMARLSVKRGLAGIDKRKHDRAEFRSDMQHIISRHEELWMKRNRIGGLMESTQRLIGRMED